MTLYNTGDQIEVFGTRSDGWKGRGIVIENQLTEDGTIVYQRGDTIQHGAITYVAQPLDVRRVEAKS